MALIIPLGFAHVVYEIKLDTDPEPMVVTMGHDITSIGGADYEDAVDQLFAAWHRNWSPVISSVYSFIGATMYAGSGGPSPFIYESVASPVVGGSALTPMPQNCAVLMRKRTSLAGRRGRGRLYMPGFREDAVTPNGSIPGTPYDALQDAADTWFEDLAGLGVDPTALPPVVLHRDEGTGVEPPPTPVTLFEVDDMIATQRQRLRR